MNQILLQINPIFHFFVKKFSSVFTHIYNPCLVYLCQQYFMLARWQKDATDDNISKQKQKFVKIHIAIIYIFKVIWNMDLNCSRIFYDLKIVKKP